MLDCSDSHYCLFLHMSTKLQMKTADDDDAVCSDLPPYKLQCETLQKFSSYLGKPSSCHSSLSSMSWMVGGAEASTGALQGQTGETDR